MDRQPDTFVKRRADAPPGFFRVEAAGLAWLAEAERCAGGVPVVEPVEVREDRIVLPRIAEVPASDAAAEEFGRRLAATHRRGAGWFGCPPDGWSGDGYIGPLLLPHVRTKPEAGSAPGAGAITGAEAGPTTGPAARAGAGAGAGDAGTGGWGAFYATQRVLPYARAARDAGALEPQDAAAIERVCARLLAADGDLTGPDEPPARLHGDLWSGNVLWTHRGVVLVDPAAHGGHRETDLAMLALFPLPRLERVLAAYHEADPLADGWRDRVPLHQLHPLLVHAVLFGGGYGASAGAAARRYG